MMPQAGPHRRGPYFILPSGELSAALPDLEPLSVKALPDLLSYEPAISTGGAQEPSLRSSRGQVGRAIGTPGATSGM